MALLLNRKNVFNPTVASPIAIAPPQLEQVQVAPISTSAPRSSGGGGGEQLMQGVDGLLSLVGRGLGAGKISGGTIDPTTGKWIPAIAEHGIADALLNGGRTRDTARSMNYQVDLQNIAQQQALERQAATLKNQKELLAFQEAVAMAQANGIVMTDPTTNGITPAFSKIIDAKGLDPIKIDAVTNTARADVSATESTEFKNAVKLGDIADQMESVYKNYQIGLTSAASGGTTAVPDLLNGGLLGQVTGSVPRDSRLRKSVETGVNASGQSVPGHSEESFETSGTTPLASFKTNPSIVNTILGTGDGGVNAPAVSVKPNFTQMADDYGATLQQSAPPSSSVNVAPTNGLPSQQVDPAVLQNLLKTIITPKEQAAPAVDVTPKQTWISPRTTNLVPTY